MTSPVGLAMPHHLRRSCDRLKRVTNCEICSFGAMVIVINCVSVALRSSTSRGKHIFINRLYALYPLLRYNSFSVAICVMML